jgi:tRNA A-37 threonylcarbamoyl transferase component Bud32
MWALKGVIMEKVKLTKSFISNFSYYGKPFSDDNHFSESQLFYNDKEMLKLLKKKYLDREKTVLRLEELQGDNICLPTSAVYEKRKFSGYTMPYYKDFKVLEDYIFGNLPFEERKRMCLDLCKIINDLRKQGFAYYDIHPFNVLYNGEKLMIVDMDSGAFRPDRYIDTIYDYETFNMYCRVGDYYLAKTVLGLLFENYRDLLVEQISSNKKELYSNSSRKLIDFYNYVIKNKGDRFDVSEHIEDIDEDYVENAKLILKK